MTPSLASVAMRVRELDRRVGVVALADADADRFARVPLLLVAACGSAAASTPATAGCRAARPRCRCRCLRAEAEAARGSARSRRCPGRWRAGSSRCRTTPRSTCTCRRSRGRPSCRRGSGAAAGTRSSPGSKIVCSACACRTSSAAERHERLEGRARRIGAAQRAVDQRLVGRIVELVPVLRVDAVDEQVRVEAGLGDEREHVAVARLDRDQRAAPVAERGLGDLLQLEVERQRRGCCRTPAAVRDSVRTARPPASISTCSKPVVPCSSRS